MTSLLDCRVMARRFLSRAREEQRAGYVGLAGDAKREYRAYARMRDAIKKANKSKARRARRR